MTNLEKALGDVIAAFVEEDLSNMPTHRVKAILINYFMTPEGNVEIDYEIGDSEQPDSKLN